MIAALITSAFLLIYKPVEVVTMQPSDMYITSIDGRQINISAEDVALIERCVMSEAGGESAECQMAVATVILNRVACPHKFPDTVPGVIYAHNQFSLHNNGEVSFEVKLNVLSALTLYDGQRFPYQLYYFRAGNYHNFGIPFKKIDNTYFSLSENVLL